LNEWHRCGPVEAVAQAGKSRVLVREVAPPQIGDPVVGRLGRLSPAGLHAACSGQGDNSLTLQTCKQADERFAVGRQRAAVVDRPRWMAL